MSAENTDGSAIILIEFQGQWTNKGIYHWLIKGQLTSRNIISNTRTLVEEARKKGIKIIHAPLIIDPAKKKGWLAHLTFAKVFTKDTWKAEITEGLSRESDLLVTGRYAFDAFIGSNMEDLIRYHDIANLFLCGFTTDQCVAKTMRTAIAKGFNCHLVSDCTATINGVFQNMTEKKFKDRVIGHLDIIEKT